jgi:hypothetical protein
MSETGGHAQQGIESETKSQHRNTGMPVAFSVKIKDECSMKAGNISLTFFILLSLMSTATADNVITQDVAAHKVEVRNVSVKGNITSGEVINKSQHAISNIEVLIQYHWLWKNEFKPDDESRGKAIFVALDKELRPGESATFAVPVDMPAASRDDGYYMTVLTLAGFTEVLPPAAG